VTIGRAIVSVWRRTIGRTAGAMVLLATAIGVLGGFGAVGFRWLLRTLQSHLWPVQEFGVDAVAALDWYWVVGVPAAAGLVVGSITRWLAPETRGHGVPEVMEAVALRGGTIRPRVVAAKALASGLCIASGGSAGREGPIVQIGAGIGSTVGAILRVGERRMRTLVGCGAAAGIAATFNAPVAGALFAVEILLGDFAVHQFSPIVISSVMATIVSRHYLQNVPAFEIPAEQLATYRLVHPAELLAYAVLGILAGFLAFTFIKALSFSENRFERSRLPSPLRAALGGGIVGLIALVFPHVLGVGYETITTALTGSPSASLLAGLIVAKLLATCVTLGSGGSGGVFAPSLFLGAMLGGLVGMGVHARFPELTAVPNAYALVGMGAVVAAAARAPITTILIVFELTSDYRIMLPLMVACIVATLFAQRLGKESIYTEKLARRGIRIGAGQDVNLLRNIPTSEVLRRKPPTVAPSEHLASIVRRLSSNEAMTLYVVGPGDRLQGVISMRELRPVLNDIDTLDDLVVATDVAASDCSSVRGDESLDRVLARLDLGYRDELPVVDDGRLLGVVRVEDVLARYRHELARRELAEGLGE